MKRKDTSLAARVVPAALCLWLPLAVASDARVRAAGCYIATPAGVVMTVGRFNAALQLPGGAREPGEAPACTAQRETLEEAGLAVDVAERLATRNNGRFELFRCIAREALHADRRLAPRDWLEVAEVVILDPETLRTPRGVRYDNAWRFAGDREMLRALFRRAAAAPRIQRDLDCPPAPGEATAR